MKLQDLKKRRANFDKIADAVKEASTGNQRKVDERFWRPTVDKAGNGYAVIRFLPAPDSEVPWVRYWDHGFKGPTGRWYIEKSRTTLGEEDPVSQHNSKLWNSGKQELARSRKRREHYVTNIMVIEDHGNPENNGKVFLYEFGKKIFEKIKSAMTPEYPDEEPVNPFDLWSGADFKLKIRKYEGYRNYDKSEFAAAEALFDGDEDKLEKVVAQLHPISEFTDPKTFKSYEELEKKFLEVIGETTARAEQTEASPELVEAPAPSAKTQEAAVVESAEDVDLPSAEVDEDEDVMAYFSDMDLDD